MAAAMTFLPVSSSLASESEASQIWVNDRSEKPEDLAHDTLNATMQRLSGQETSLLKPDFARARTCPPGRSKKQGQDGL